MINRHHGGFVYRGKQDSEKHKDQDQRHQRKLNGAEDNTGRRHAGGRRTGASALTPGHDTEDDRDDRPDERQKHITKDTTHQRNDGKGFARTFRATG